LRRKSSSRPRPQFLRTHGHRRRRFNNETLPGRNLWSNPRHPNRPRCRRSHPARQRFALRASRQRLDQKLRPRRIHRQAPPRWRSHGQRRHQLFRHRRSSPTAAAAPAVGAAPTAKPACKKWCKSNTSISTACPAAKNRGGIATAPASKTPPTLSSNSNSAAGYQQNCETRALRCERFSATTTCAERQHSSL